MKLVHIRERYISQDLCCAIKILIMTYYIKHFQYFKMFDCELKTGGKGTVLLSDVCNRNGPRHMELTNKCSGLTLWIVSSRQLRALWNGIFNSNLGTVQCDPISSTYCDWNVQIDLMLQVSRKSVCISTGHKNQFVGLGVLPMLSSYQQGAFIL